MLSLWLASSIVLSVAALPPTTGAVSSLNAALEGVGAVFNELECSLTPIMPSTYWYESITHNGISPFIPNGTDWPVFRNVKTMFGAKGDGVTDDSDAFQNAINAGNSYAQRNTNDLGTTGQPAVVYLPKGVYVLAKPIQFFVGMILMGDPINPPTIKAAGNFSGDFMIYAKDPSQGSTTNFYVGMKNVILDSMDYDKDKNLTLVDWSVSQACQLANVRFDMPYESTGHIGVAMPEGGSGLILEDLYFHGGVVGILLSNQQYHLKSLTFDGCRTGISVQHLFMGHCQGCKFTLCGIGVDTSSPGDGIKNLGTFIITDSAADNTGALVSAPATNGSFASIVLENVQVDEQSVSSTVTVGGDVVLKGSVKKGEAWVLGDAYTSDKSTDGVFQKGVTLATARSRSLVDSSGSFYRLTPPTYEEYGIEQIVNVKEVPLYSVAGDGKADDTASLQAIINKYAGCKVLFFPYGIYLVTDTLVFPPGSRVFGEAWSTISATGSKFINPSAPIPMIKVGEPGDTGVAQFSDMLFTVEDILPGCTLLEVNMAGEKPGDVGFWNTHFRVGGAADSQTQKKCGPGVTTDPDQCKAAFMLAHFTASSSAYVDNMWGWTADHDLDGVDNPLTNPQYISVGRGVLIESTKPSWFIGFASEHNTLYEVNINGAENVFVGFQQSETPYWQGGNSSLHASDPWTPVALKSDPDFSWCAADDAHCRMSIYQRISDSKDLNLYAGGFWTFFNANKACDAGVSCQTDAVRIDNSTGVSILGLGVNHVGNLVVQDGKPIVTSVENKGGWFANVAAYLIDS
ncbi:glycoside hydrolase family 55 protein [Annulohypoxylon maeteangense]|uniref:glycoside hydrolase family 55 protein n=1 Tax=Annulohypoxylon maeteangense TaxID=1927788 RepID=UPI0020079785|nr:glycoside hydrolase family 55 protein [Annulohypoxylon maeteangense]KAI0882532.1 glycoside hydrolase family 55 protein [Annulohypoxylon maeteangense]